MEISILLFKQIVSLFLMIGMGYTIVKLGLIKSEESKSLSTILLYLVVPCVIIHAFQVELSSDTVHGLILALVVSIFIHLIMIVITYALKKPFKLTSVEMASMIYSNAGNLIIPIVTSVLGEEWVFYSVAYMAFQLVLFWTHCKYLVSNDKKFDFKKIITNINLIAILIGLVLFITQIRLPSIIDNTTAAISNLIAPLSMFVTGMLIANVNLKKVLSQKRVYLVIMFRLIILPLIVLIILRLSNLSSLVTGGKTILLVTFLATIAPSASTIVQMSQVFGNEKDAEYASAINVVSTLFCIITMPVMVYIYML